MYLKEPYRTTDRSAACKRKNAYPLGFRVISGQRYLHTELGRWLSRDPIHEIADLNLYVLLANAAGNEIDILGEMSFRDAWRAGGSFLRSLLSLPGAILSEVERRAEAGELSAWGGEAGASAVVITGGVVGGAIMFFPKTCEFAAYDYVAGPIGTRSRGEVQDELVASLEGDTFGFSVGVSVKAVRGWPKAVNETQDARSWLGFFSTADASIPVPALPIFGVAGEAFWSDDWWGFGVGGSASVGIAAGYIAHYSWLGSDEKPKRWTVKPKCLCNMFRYLGQNMPEAVPTIADGLKEAF